MAGSIWQRTVDVDADGNVSIDGDLKMKEAAVASADTVAYGQVWIKNTQPCELYFTTDAGNDIQITSGTAIAGGGGGAAANSADTILHMQVFA